MPRRKKETDTENIKQTKVNADEVTEKKATSAKKPRKKKSESQKTDGTVAKKAGRPRKKPVNEEEKDTLEVVHAEKVESVNSSKIKGVGGNGNLIPLNQKTKEEQRKICTKGGVASGIARRKKKELREFTKDFLLQDAAPVLQSNMKVLGVDTEQMTNLSAMVVRLFNKAVNQGDLNAARTLIEWAGMAPLQQERENEAIARMSQVMQLANGDDSGKDDEEMDVVFYIPENGRPLVTDDDLVTVGVDADD